MKIGIASDRQGIELKQHLTHRLNALDRLTVFTESELAQPHDDGAAIKRLAFLLQSRSAERAVMVCTNAMYASIDANKQSCVRAAVCHEASAAYDLVRIGHLNFLILDLHTMSTQSAEAVVDAFLAANYSAAETHSGIPPCRLRSIVGYVRSNLHLPLTVNTLATLAKMSPSHFSKLFKISLGVSPYQFVLRERIERSKNLLRGSEARIMEIAFQVGFETQAHFTTAFRNLVGITPKEFRRRITTITDKARCPSHLAVPVREQRMMARHGNSQN